MLVSDSDNKFVQIYFIGNSIPEIDLWCTYNTLVKRSIVEQLQTFVHQHKLLITPLKTALDLMPSDNHKIVNRGDKTPVGQYAEGPCYCCMSLQRMYEALQDHIIFW